MKSKFLIAAAFLMIIGTAAQAQLKIGYTNIDFIVGSMPETRQMESEYKSYESKLEEQFQSRVAEFTRKRDEFEKNAATMIEEVRLDRQAELQDMYNRIQQFETDVQQSLQKKRFDLLQPAYDKAQKAIEDVAKENGYTFILSDGQGAVLLFAPEEHNITNLVFKKLGVPIPADGAGK
jgi:outer membrane protein